MTGEPTIITASLTTLRGRWGTDIVRTGAHLSGPRSVATLGALALVPRTIPGIPDGPSAAPGAIVSSGFPELDELLGGLPRQGSLSFVGAASSGLTTLAQRTVAEAQVAGAIVAWLDLPARFDPLEAATRGVDLRWLVVVRPVSPVDGLRIGGSLVASRSVDLLVVDLPPRLAAGHADTLRRIASQARRMASRVLVLGPAGLTGAVRDALAEASQLRLGLTHRDWLRVGREVVGQRVCVTVEKDRAGAPGRSVDIEIRYPVEGERGPALGRLLVAGADPPMRERPIGLTADPWPPMSSPLLLSTHPTPTPESLHRPIHAIAASPLGPPAAPPGAPSRRPVTRTGRAGRTPLGSGCRP